EMIRGLVELLAHPGSKVERAAVVSDVRGGELFEALVGVLDDLEASGIAHRVLFLDADDETLLTRYKETRRRHPLSPAGTVATGCAGGGDRSVCIADELTRRFGGREDLHVDVAHRDIDKAPKGP